MTAKPPPSAKQSHAMPGNGLHQCQRTHPPSSISKMGCILAISIEANNGLPIALRPIASTTKTKSPLERIGTSLVGMANGQIYLISPFSISSCTGSSGTEKSSLLATFTTQPSAFISRTIAVTATPPFKSVSRKRQAYSNAVALDLNTNCFGGSDFFLKKLNMQMTKTERRIHIKIISVQGISCGNGQKALAACSLRKQDTHV
jgi:hypothetical protein